MPAGCLVWAAFLILLLFQFLLVSLIIFQTFIHVGVNANLLPTTGMTLPFLSYGGSSLISSGIIAGIILNYTSLEVEN